MSKKARTDFPQHHPSSRLGLPAMLLGAALFAAPALAERTLHESHIVKVKTADAELVEADVSDLGLGESLSFVTESGHTVDILKAAEGLEIYLDGELLNDVAAAEMDARHDALLHERIEIECTSDERDDCAERVAVIMADGVTDGAAGTMVFIDEEQVEIVCDGESEADCEALAWVSDGELDFDGDVDFHVERADATGDHEFVVIRKEIRED
jgi:hypothetical protein